MSLYMYSLIVDLPMQQANFSFSGAFTPLSKLIVCVVMLRGRHRGLPVAIDRAVLLPSEYKKKDVNGIDDTADIIAQAGFKQFTPQAQAQTMNEKGPFIGNDPVIDDAHQTERGPNVENVPSVEKAPHTENGLA